MYALAAPTLHPTTIRTQIYVMMPVQQSPHLILLTPAAATVPTTVSLLILHLAVLLCSPSHFRVFAVDTKIYEHMQGYH